MDRKKSLESLSIKYNNKELMYIERDSIVWFKGKDVASMLGYVNAEKSIRTHVDKEDKISYKEYGET